MAVYADGELVLYGFVGDDLFDEGFTATQVLAALAEHGRDNDITVHLNSGGGYAMEGVAIYNALAAHKGKVRVEIDAVAASAASVVAMAGDEIVMRSGSLMMIHDPAALTMGPASEHAKSLEILNKMGESMASIYAERSGNDVAEVRTAMQGELWLNADEAVSQGYADEAESTKAEVAAAFDYRVYAHAPKRLVALAKRKNWSLDEASTRAAASATAPTRQKETAMTDKTQAEATAKAETEAEAAPEPQNPAPEANAEPKAADPRERIKAILDLDEAKGRDEQAKAIALETDLSVEQAKSLLAKAPKANATASIAERAKGNGADVSAAAGRPDAVAAGWDDVVAKVNAQYGVGTRQ